MCIIYQFNSKQCIIWWVAIRRHILWQLVWSYIFLQKSTLWDLRHYCVKMWTGKLEHCRKGYFLTSKCIHCYKKWPSIIRYTVDELHHEKRVIMSYAKLQSRSACIFTQSDQAFCYLLIYSTVSINSVSGQWRPWSDCPNGQSDQGLHCPHMQ